MTTSGHKKRRPKSPFSISLWIAKGWLSLPSRTIPPIPPISGIAGAASWGLSVTIASVVIIRPATDAANCSALRSIGMVGSRMPLSDHVARIRQSQHCNRDLPSPARTLLATTDSLQLLRCFVIWRIGAVTRSATRIPTFCSSLSSRLATLDAARISATPPAKQPRWPTAARVAWEVRLLRGLFFSFISTSVAAPTCDYCNTASWLSNALLKFFFAMLCSLSLHHTFDLLADLRNATAGSLLLHPRHRWWLSFL